MLGLQLYEATLCPGCGQPRHLAWHRESEGEWEGNHFICHACTAKSGPGDEQRDITYARLSYEKAQDRIAAMADFDMQTVTPARAKPSTPTS